jgi:hypothetical protein
MLTNKGYHEKLLKCEDSCNSMLHTLQHNKVSFPGVMNHEKKMLNKKSLHREFCPVGGFLLFGQPRINNGGSHE